MIRFVCIFDLYLQRVTLVSVVDVVLCNHGVLNSRVLR